MAIQMSDQIVDSCVAPKISELTKCGAPILRKGQNHFASYLLLASLGPKKYKPRIHALLVVFHRRVDFACVAYRQGRNRLANYVDQPKNSNTRIARLAMSYFETCALHVVAATLCGEAILKSLEQPSLKDDRVDRLRKIANRVRHFDEDILEIGKVKRPFGIAPVWLTNQGLECSDAKISFQELRKLLQELVAECGEFNKILTP